MTRLTWEQVLAWRVRRQYLDERVSRRRLVDVVSRLCGVHAQLMSSAELTLWARVDGLGRDAVQRALWRDRRLVKTWAMRGTLHLLPAAEYALWQGALSTYDHFLKPAWLRAFGVTREELDAMLGSIAEVLEGRTLTREELATEVARRGGRDLADKVRQSWGSALKPASYRGLLCFAPSDGARVRFTRPDTWLGTWQPQDGPAAMEEVTRRYLAAYGPATREDFARWWSGITTAAAGRLLRSIPEAAELELDGATAFMLERHVEEAATAAPARSIRLLPAFDQYVVVGPRAAEAVLPARYRERVFRPQAWISPVLLVDGRMVGVWRHQRKGRRLVVTIEPFGKIVQRVRRAATEEAERLAEFLGGTLEVVWS